MVPKSARLINLETRQSLTCHRRHPWNRTARDPCCSSSTDHHPADIAVHCSRVTRSSARTGSTLRSGWAGSGRRRVRRPRRCRRSWLILSLPLLGRQSSFAAPSARLLAALRPVNSPSLVAATPCHCKAARCWPTGIRSRRRRSSIRHQLLSSFCHPPAPPLKLRSCSESATSFWIVRDEERRRSPLKKYPTLGRWDCHRKFRAGWRLWLFRDVESNSLSGVSLLPFVRREV